MSTPAHATLLLAASAEMLLLVERASLRIVATSPATEATLGYAPGALSGHPVTELECALVDMFFWEEVQAGGRAVLPEADSLYRRADGDLLEVRRSVQHATPDGAWISIRALPATGRKQAEEELATMSARLRATLEATPDGILVRDRQGRVANLNRRFAQMWQIPDALLLDGEHESLLGFLGRQLAEPGLFEEMMDAARPTEDGETFFSLPLADGRVFECTSRPARHGEQIIGRVYCTTDVTERHLAEQALIAARDAATAASRAKGEFLAMMSHEIRTPLNGILGMIELLGAGPLGAEQRDYLATMRSSGDALLGVINDVLDYSKIEARKLALEVTRFAPAALLAELEHLFAVQMRNKGLEFRIHARTALPGALEGDPVRLRQILLNLVSNALKFTAAGSITVEAAELSREGRQCLLRFAVRDTGVGIAAEKLGPIFAPFEQADRSTTRRYGGTGLGLSICRMLSELMGGRIGVHSTPGSGSEFWVELPFGLAEGAAVASEPASGADFTLPDPDLPILVVEDNRVNVMVLTQLLRKLGARRISVARDGQEALDHCAHEPCAVIFMDTHMPGMDGREAVVALRARGLGAYVIGVSADAMSADREAALAAGMNDYLTKPVSLAALGNALARWLAAQPARL